MIQNQINDGRESSKFTFRSDAVDFFDTCENPNFT